MCICMEPAKLSKTVLYAGEAKRDGKTVHVLGYQNTAQHLGEGTGGNAMILPIPSAAPMGPANVLDTSSCPSILKDIAEAIPRPRSRSLGFSKGLDMDDMSFSVQVFDTGIYTVVLASPGAGVAEIRRALDGQVSDERRPPVKDAMIASFLANYPKSHLALCCFGNADEIEADPLLWWYEPIDSEVLFAPGLDAHDGNPPDLRAEVEVDHQVAFGSYRLEAGAPVAYSDTGIPTAVKALLPAKINGKIYRGEAPNGDFACRIEDLLKPSQPGGLKVDRVPPPGAR